MTSKFSDYSPPVPMPTTAASHLLVLMLYKALEYGKLLFGGGGGLLMYSLPPSPFPYFLSDLGASSWWKNNCGGYAEI